MSTKPKARSDKPIEDVMKNLKIDAGSDVNLAAVPPSSDETSGSVKSSDIDQEYNNYVAAADQQGVYYPPNSYYGYYYPGYDGSVGEVEDQGGYYFSNDGLEIQYPAAAMQADNGSLLYYMQPNYQSGYVPYNPYSPSTAIGIDGQYLNPQSYMLTPLSPQPVSPSFYYPNPLSYGAEVMQSYVWDPSFQVADVTQGNTYGYPTVPLTKQHVPSHTIASSKSTPLSKSNSDTKPSLPALDVSATVMYNDLKPVNKAAAVLAKSYYPLSKFPHTNQGKGGLLYPTASVKVNGRGWSGPEKLKPRGKTGVGEFDLLNEQNRGPRTNSTKSTVVSGTDQAESLAAEGNAIVTIIRRDEYNLLDFNTKYEHGLFFVIKSYSEDDIHKSIKYNVWASTPNGNKRLDSAYQIAQEKMNQKGSKCPVFLFFSVNASGQFCGVAEMMGRVDFDQNMNFWQQDKWNGFFPVKWHFIKDVPNPHFRHIILENNDNKPVTNSRDTQEIRLPQGLEMLNVFKNYVSKTSILDDFAFYESRQKVMEDKRIRTPIHHYGHFQKLDEVTQVGVNTQPSCKVAQIAVNIQPSDEVTQVAESVTPGDTDEVLVEDTAKE